MTPNQRAFLVALAAADGQRGRMPGVWYDAAFWEVSGKKYALSRNEAEELQRDGLVMDEATKYKHVLVSEWWTLDITDAGRELIAERLNGK